MKYRNDDDARRYEFKYEENRRKYSGDEYSDDLRHLIQHKKPMNSTLFDDMVVGTETENNAPDRESSLYDGHEDPFERSEEAQKPAENDYEGRYHHQKNSEEERAGMADESMKTRTSSVENDKRNDLMIAHRHYEDTAEALNDRNKEDGNDEDRMRPNERYMEGEHGFREPHNSRGRRRYYEKYHRNGAINGYKHRHSKSETYKSEDGEEKYSSRPSEASGGRRIHSDNEESESSGSGENLDGHFASRYYAGSRQHGNLHENLFHSAKSLRKKGKSREKASLHSHLHASSRHKSHGHKSKKSGGKKSLGMSKEEKLIEKLEHLEEKIEKKQKTDIESSNEKILNKVETLANKLEKKTSDDRDEKGREKGKLDKKKKAKEETNEAKNGVRSDKKTIDGKITELLESSGEKEGHEKDSSPEKIIIPLEVHHHKKSNKKSPKIKKHPHESQSHEAKTHSNESSGEGSGSHHLEGSGGGEDEDGVVAHYLSYERDHKVEDTNWPSTQLVVPYSEKKSHAGHHSSHKMPVLNENIEDKLGKDQYEKKDKIAKPSIKDKYKLKGQIKKEKSNATVVQDTIDVSKKSHIEIKHKKKKSHSKSKQKTKNSKKAIEKLKLMKEFEKYKAFIKAQELAISGDGSGEQGSGRVAHVKMKKLSDKKRSKRKKKKHKGKENKKGDKHKKAKEGKTKNKNASIKSSTHKHFEELVSSGYSQEHGSGEAETHVEGEKTKKEKEATMKKKEKGGEKQHHYLEKNKHSIANKKSGSFVKSKLLVENSSLNTSGIISKGNESTGIPQQKKNSSLIDEGPKPFHDRKENAASDDNSYQKPKSLENTTKVPLVKDTKSVPKPKILEKGRPRGEVISERNTSWPHPKTGSTSQDKTKAKQKQIQTLHSSSSGISHKNKTVQVQESSRVDTTHRVTKEAGRPTTKTTRKLVTTTAPTTTIPTTRKRTTTATAKKKPKKVKPKPTTRMTTTVIPTLSILTGDEDVEPTVRPTKHKSKKSKNTHSDKKTRTKKPAILKKNPNIARRKDYVKGKKEKGVAKPRTTESPIEEEPVATEKPLEFQPPPTVPAIVQQGPVQQRFPGQGGSTGILGDLQLPEPPGNGNRASGPLFYGQQGVPGNLPMQQPLGPMQYRKMPMGNPPGFDPSQLIYGEKHHQGSAAINPQNIIGKTPEEIKRPFNPTVTTFPPTQYFGYSPMERPTTLPLIGFHNNEVKPSIVPSKKPQNGAPQSPENIIQRILGVPHKLSPLNVIQNILKPKNAVHKENKGVAKPSPTKQPSQSKEKNVKGQNLRGQNTKGQNKGQQIKEQKPNEKKKIPLQNQGKKMPSPTGKKPSGSARNLKEGRKHPLGRLNDFFKNANDANLLKTTGNFWHLLQYMVFAFCY